MLEHWKRENATVAMAWGTSHFEEHEMDRPQFIGEPKKSFIDGSDMVWFAPEERFSRLIISRSFLTGLLSLICGVVASIYVLKFELSAPIGSYASVVASVINTMQITLFNMLYQVIAVQLTDGENYRTDTNYEDSLIVKLFVFQFINSYASFFFLAFIAAYLVQPPNTPSDWIGQCGAADCMQPLSINLAIIFGTRLTLTNFLDIFIPYWNYKNKLKEETKGTKGKTLSPFEEDYMLMEYDPMLLKCRKIYVVCTNRHYRASNFQFGRLESITNYADIAVQFGFSMLFVTALPIASFFSLLSNYAKVKFNAWKLLTFYQRPIPVTAQDIGTWESIFRVITVAAVFTNAGLVCFTMQVLDGFTLFQRTW
mmetsp:Transcript_21436/g.30713  ORF Transcript_21436/g.30713 Transcript_21436/m.30713 type:complete len:368 (+) Transcript_21436:20-1123(+)